jgi:hypothetical protein
VGVTMRALVMSAYYPVLMLQRDTYTYLARAAGLSGSGFRPILYPLVIKPAVTVENVALVAGAQHLLGLVIAVIIYLLLRRVGAGPWLGALGAAPVALDGYQLNLEHYLLTETMFQGLIVGSIAIMTWHGRPAVWAIAVAGAMLALAGFTRFVGLVLIGPAIIYVAWARLGWLRLGALVLPFAAVVIIYPRIAGPEDSGSSLATRTGPFLYGRVASFADCNEVEIEHSLSALCFDSPPAERGPNYGFFALRLPREVTKKSEDFLHFSMTMISAQPFDYIRTVSSDFWRYIEPQSPPTQEPYVARWQFVETIDQADPRPLVLEKHASPPRELGFDQPFTIDRSAAEFLRSYQNGIFLWGPLIGVSLLLGIAGMILGPGRVERNLNATSGLFTLSALTLLLVPVMVTVYHFRYSIGALPLIAPAGVIGVVALRARFRPEAVDREVRVSDTTETMSSSADRS